VGVHEAAAEGFSRGAQAYERGRPGYPQAAVRWLVERLPIRSGSTVVDLGAGTGKFTRLLVPTGARIIAVEPVAAMREALIAAVPTVEAVEGTAQSIPLPAASVDAIVAAQAFHWFATPDAVEEMHRVLTDGGGLGLIWNRRDLSDPLQASLDAVVRPHRGEAPAHEWDRWREALIGNPRFAKEAERRFSLQQVVDQAGAVDRVTSTSFIARMDDAQRAEIADQVRAIVPAQGTVVLRYVTDVFLFRRAAT
jgi:SAM-dependent methyltransferase